MTYGHPAGAIDEMVDGNNGVRRHWRNVLSAISGFGPTEMAERGRRLDRAFEEEGVSAVLPGVAPGADRLPWRCDPIPLPLTAAEYATLESGLAQRARLMQALLSDIYGPLQTVADGLVPPALVFANPSFLRESRVTPAVPPLLHFYAADLLRGPDGAWRVIADRTNAPAGAGYARENRRLLARVLPEAFRSMQVRPLRPFFDLWQDSLSRLAPGHNPAVALLTPGTGHPQWFEHMFLARELGCALVEGGDLTVRGGVVFLKTLRGLQRIDVLVRRLDGRMIDPLELTAGSLLGATGLMDAARTGAVRIVNDPGSGVLEAPALAAYLPDLAMRLLGEPLQLASVPTLWLGSPRAQEIVQRDLARWLIRPALDGAVSATAAAALSPSAVAQLAQQIARAPGDFAATTAITPSVAPCITPSGTEPRPVMLRMFLVHDGARWRVMDGALARVLEPGSGLAGSLPGRGVSKDVWVLHEDGRDIVGPALNVEPPMAIRRSSGELPSRVADDFFWLGRYVERLEAWARLSRSVLNRIARGMPLPHELAELRVLSACLSEIALEDDEPRLDPTPRALAIALRTAVGEDGLFGWGLTRVARLVEAVRDRITGEMHAAFTHALRAARDDLAGNGAGDANVDALLQAMGGVQRLATTVAGVAAENMVRGGGWLFLETGRRLERAHATAGQLAVVLDQSPPRMESGLRMALELCDSAITYANRYRSVLQAAPVMDLVLADRSNPRALGFQFAALKALLTELGDVAGADLASPAVAFLAQVEAMVASVAARTDAPAAEAARQAAKLAGMADGVGALSDRISRTCFALLPAVQTVGMPGLLPPLRGAA